MRFLAMPALVERSKNMHKFYTGVVKYRRAIMVFFVVSAIICLFLSDFVDFENSNAFL